MNSNAPSVSDRSHTRFPLATFVIVSVALFMVTLDNLVVSTALPSIRVDLGASLESLAVDGQRLHARLRRLPAHRRGAGRPLRPAAHVPDRHRRVHRRVGARRARSQHRCAGGRARAAGPGRRADHAADAHDAVRRGRRPAAAGWRSACGRASAGSASRSARWSAARSSTGVSWHWIFWVNVPDRRRPAAVRPHAPRPESTARTPARPASAVGLAGAGLLALVFGIVRAEALGWTSATIVGQSRHRRRAARGVPRLGGSCRRADAAAALLPQPRLLGDERRVVRDVLRRLRLDLLPLAVSSRPRRGTRRFRPGCGRCRGPRCRCSWRPSPASCRTASARGR